MVGSETDARDYIDFIVTALCDCCNAHTVRIYTYHTRREREKEPRLLTALQMDKVIDTDAPSASSPAPTRHFLLRIGPTVHTVTKDSVDEMRRTVRPKRTKETKRLTLTRLDDL